MKISTVLLYSKEVGLYSRELYVKHILEEDKPVNCVPAVIACNVHTQKIIFSVENLITESCQSI